MNRILRAIHRKQFLLAAGLVAGAVVVGAGLQGCVPEVPQEALGSTPNPTRATLAEGNLQEEQPSGQDRAVYLGDPTGLPDLEALNYPDSYSHEPLSATLISVDSLGGGEMLARYELPSPVPRGRYSGVMIQGGESTAGYECETVEEAVREIACRGPLAVERVDFHFEINKVVQLPSGDGQPFRSILALSPSLLLDKDFSMLAQAVGELNIPIDSVGVPQAWDIVAYCLNFLDTGETIPSGCYDVIFDFYGVDEEWLGQLVPEVDLCLAMFQAGMEIDDECAWHIIEIGAEGDDFWQALVPPVTLPGEGRVQLYDEGFETALFESAVACAETLVGGSVDRYDLDEWREIHSFYKFLNSLFRPDACSGFDCFKDFVTGFVDWWSEAAAAIIDLVADPVGFWTDFLAQYEVTVQEWVNASGPPADCQTFLDLADRTYFHSDMFGVANACAQAIGYDRDVVPDSEALHPWPSDLFLHLQYGIGGSYYSLPDACREFMDNCWNSVSSFCDPSTAEEYWVESQSPEKYCEQAQQAGEESLWCREPGNDGNPFQSQALACADELGWPLALSTYQDYRHFSFFVSINSPWLLEGWPTESCLAVADMLGEDNPSSIPLQSLGENQTTQVLYAITSSGTLAPRPTRVPTAKPEPTSSPLSRIRGKVTFAGSGQAGHTVRLATGTCGFGVIVGERTTGADGSYSFSGLAPGSYCVTLFPIAGWVCDTPASCKSAVDAPSGGTKRVDFTVRLN